MRDRHVARLTIAASFMALGLIGCGTFNLGYVHPQTGKNAEQRQLDILTCKDQANMAVNSAGQQISDFLLGLTIVGAPVAYENDKDKERGVFRECMTARGYVVTAEKGSAPSPPLPSRPPSATVPAASSSLALAAPQGFVSRTVPDSLKPRGVVLYAVNRTFDVAYTVAADDHTGITDVQAYATTRRSSQADRLSDATYTDVMAITVGGRPAFRYHVSGTINNMKVTYVTTIIEARTELIIVSAWTGTSNAEVRKELLESLAETVTGIS